MRISLMICLMMLWALVGLSGSAAAPPAKAPAPATSTPAPAATPGAPSTTTPPTAPAAHTPPAASPAPAVPDRIEPTEKVHSDAEISFPVDI